MVGLCLPSCKNKSADSAWWAGENERISLSQDLALKQFRYEQVFQPGREELISLTDENAAREKMLQSLESEKKSLTKELRNMEVALVEAHENRIRETREKITGATYDVLTLDSGRTFKDAKIASVDDTGVSVRHADGSARLAFSDLSTKEHQKFGLDAERAMLAERREQEQLAAYERLMDVRMAEMKAEQARSNEIASRERIAASNRAASQRQAANNRAIALANARPLAQPSRRFGGVSYSRSYSSYYRPRYRYYYTPYRNVRSFVGGVCNPRPRYVAPYRTPRQRFSNTTITDIP